MRSPISIGDHIAVAELREVPLGPTLSNTRTEAVLRTYEVTYVSKSGVAYYEESGRLRAAKEPICVVRS